MHVHARTVVTNDRLRHEGGCLAVLVSHVQHTVLQNLSLVGAANQRIELGTDFVLTRGSHFVVVHFDFNTAGFHGITHGRTDIVEAINRGNREVTTLNTRTVTGVATFDLGVRRPGRFFREDLHEGTRHVGLPFDRIKNKEFRFRTKEGGVANTRALQVGFGALGDRTRVAVIALAVGRLDHVTGQDQGGFVIERINIGRGRIRNQQHVGGLNAFPTGDRRAVEGLAFFELLFAELADRHANVLLLATGIGKTEVDELDVVVLDQLQDVLHGGHNCALLITTAGAA